MKVNFLLKHFFFALVLITASSCNSKKSTEATIASEFKDIVDPLPSWNDNETKTAIIAYVTDVTNETSKNFIPIKDRISTFDNDGNLWSEQPPIFNYFLLLIE